MHFRALTVRQPWAALIVAGLKDIENRSWRPPTIPDVLIIHSAERRADHPTGVARVDGDDIRGALLGVVHVSRIVKDADSPWAMDDQWHWVLEGARALEEPIYVTGARGLWELSPKVLRVVRQQTERPRLSRGQ